jgi:hypothetical protein
MTTWRAPALDDDAAEAVALMALYISGSERDASLAAELLDELTARPEGMVRTIGGLASLCSALLALHEFDTGLAPETVLRHAAIAVQQALV